MSPKSQLRAQIGALPALSAGQRAAKSAAIVERLLRDPAWQTAQMVALFAPQMREPDVELLWPFARGRTFCFPRVRAQEIDFFSVVEPSQLVESRWKLREPTADASKMVPPGSIDLILVPGVAFTRAGERMGRGGGFYDRLLSHPALRAVRIGVCFESQVVENLPAEPHDLPVQRVITESFP